MKKRQIIIAALITTVVFFAISHLKGNVTYLKQLTATTMVRSMTEKLSEVLQNQGQPAVNLNFIGQSELAAPLTEELIKQAGLNIKKDAPLTLNIVVNKDKRNLNASLTLSKEGEELFDAQRSMALGNWTSLLPPLLAIILAICLRKVLFSLGAAIWLGAAFHPSWNPLKATWYAASNYLWGNFVGEFSLTILGFVFVLVGMANLINRGGGMAGVVEPRRPAVLVVAQDHRLAFADEVPDA